MKKGTSACKDSDYAMQFLLTQELRERYGINMAQDLFREAYQSIKHTENHHNIKAGDVLVTLEFKEAQ